MEPGRLADGAFQSHREGDGRVRAAPVPAAVRPERDVQAPRPAVRSLRFTRPGPSSSACSAPTSTGLGPHRSRPRAASPGTRGDRVRPSGNRSGCWSAATRAITAGVVGPLPARPSPPPIISGPRCGRSPAGRTGRRALRRREPHVLRRHQCARVAVHEGAVSEFDASQRAPRPARRQLAQLHLDPLGRPAEALPQSLPRKSQHAPVLPRRTRGSVCSRPAGSAPGSSSAPRPRAPRATPCLCSGHELAELLEHLGPEGSGSAPSPRSAHFSSTLPARENSIEATYTHGLGAADVLVHRLVEAEALDAARLPSLILTDRPPQNQVGHEVVVARRWLISTSGRCRVIARQLAEAALGRSACSEPASRCGRPSHTSGQACE